MISNIVYLNSFVQTLTSVGATLVSMVVNATIQTGFLTVTALEPVIKETYVTKVKSWFY